MKGKKGLIMGVANERSIAWGISQKLAESGAELAFTYLGDALKKRVVPLAEKLNSKITFSCDVEKKGEVVKLFEDTYYKEVYDTLTVKYKLGRVRLLWKLPRTTLSWHRDPEPRLHIPIITNPGCIMVIDNVAKHMPADGSVWITNNKKYHNAFNGGEENRIHLVACVLDYKFN